MTVRPGLTFKKHGGVQQLCEWCKGPSFKSIHAPCKKQRARVMND